ncbi:hypothetical protein [Nocardia asteroides]|uniref:hypothetical protein n=1 Tax=Nocardia asteroides TaxID=1824 RepID=UPI001E36B8C7|nr:hypothetical protein [Nocardia asteroides]UGT60003.1 hypothetical protein LTT61_22640 [Nocardia asteroides]
MTAPGQEQGPPVDPTVLDLLRGSALAPMLDRPVGEILHDMGFPALPDLTALPPLPGLPPLPVLDLSALMRPLTDLAAAFGTGKLPEPVAQPVLADPAAAPAPPADPTQMLQQVGTILQSVTQLGSTALQAVMQVWQSMAAEQAAAKAGQAQADGAELATQSTQEKAIIGNGATSVFIGAAELAAVIAKFSATLAAAPLYATSGPGMAFLVASAVESAAEGVAITVKTKAEMLGHSASMTGAGQKVAVTSAPKGVDGAQQLSQLLGMLTPLLSTATQVATTVAQTAAKPAHTALLAPVRPEDEAPRHDPAKPIAASGGGAGAGGGGFGGGGGFAAAPAPLSPWQGTRAAGGPVGGLTGASTAAAPAAVAPAAASGGHGGNGGFMPAGGAAGALGGAGLAREGESSTDGVRGVLVTGSNGDEVVGRIDGVTLPVVGATVPNVEPPPDRDLRL